MDATLEILSRLSGRAWRAPFLSAELHPPGRPAPEALLDDARSLAGAGADLLFVPDAPSGRIQWDAVSAATLVARETGIPCVPHINGRDRNAVAIEGLLVAAAAAGLRAVKAVTGDPVDTDAGRGVYEWDSERITLAAADLHRREKSGPAVVVGHRVGTTGSAIEAERLRRKVEAGAGLVVLTPTLDPGVLAEAVARAGAAGIPVAASLVLVTSTEALAALGQDEPGFSAPAGLAAALGVARDPLAAGIAAGLAAAEAVRDRVSGLHVASPHGRSLAAIPLLRALRQGR